MIHEEIDLAADNRLERRLEPRPEPPQPHLAPRTRRFIDAVAEKIDASWIGWLLYSLTSLIAVAYIVWTLVIHTTAVREDHTKMVELADLERTYVALTDQFSRDELRELLDKISTAERSVFPDYAKLAGWLSRQADAARTLDLNLSYVMLDTVPAQIKNVAEVPIELTLVPLEGHESGAYLRMLGYLRGLVDATEHLEITDASLRGNGRTAERLESTIHIWVDMP